MPCDIDMFDSSLSHQLHRYMSWRPDPQEYIVDALAFYWIDCKGYAFPPFSLLHAVLQKVEQEELQIVLVAPL